MKSIKRLFMAVIAICLIGTLSVTSVYADESVKRVQASDREMSAEYWDFIGIPSSYFNISCNGSAESGRNLSNAFDRNFSTSWKSGTANNVNDFHNRITVEFKGPVKLERLLYASANEADGKGYPTSLKLHVYGEDGKIMKTFSFTSSNTTQATVFSLGEVVTCKKAELEWVDVPRYHYWNATAGEIIFLQPDMEIPEIFSDFCRLTLNEKYDTKEELDELKETLKGNVNYDGSISEDFLRAEKVLSGELSWDKRRQMSVVPENGEAVLRQEGNMQSYMRDVLDFGWYGTNKQILGVSGQKNEKITIYVDAKEGDPLPKVICSQYFGHWSGWQTGEIQLSRGKNVITIPTWDESKLTWPSQIVSGGPIYIANPYTPAEQSDQVKVYVEGGQTFPVFRKGGDIEEYKAFLAEYMANRDVSKTYDLTELESDYTQMTVKASSANRIYNQNGASPETNLVNWDKYMRSLLEFDGIEFDKDDPLYNEKNEHLRLNFRLAQPYGAAFGSNSQVGIFYDDWVNPTMNMGGTLGWGFAHEIGHCMDTWQCCVSECTNNMISKYDETVRGAASRGEFANDLNALTNDRTLKDTSYFDTNRMNFLVWWHVESRYPGTWAEMKNLYRYSTESTAGMNGTERQIYYMSLACGVDLGPYFERFGYRLSTNDPVFKVSEASEKYTEMMNSKEIDSTKCTKFWYLDGAEYNYVKAGKKLNLYDESVVPEILSVKKVAGGYSILMPKDSKEGHLGYEILEGDDVIGFTYGRTFTDKSAYEEGYIPSYRVRAYDRGLNFSSLSAAKSTAVQTDVCRINDTMYDSLAEAVENAAAGDVIVILKDISEGGITVSRNLTITAESDVKITKAGAGSIITVTAGTLTIEGGNYITFDGDDFTQNGSLIELNGGALTVRNAILENNDNTGNGGAIYAPNGTLYIEGCTIRNNRAANGGAVAIGSKCTAKILNCSILKNEASGNGGGINSLGGGIITSLKGTEVCENKAVNGGGLWLDGRTTVDGASVSRNTASGLGGGIYMGSSNTARSVDIIGGTVLDSNRALKGGNAIYIDKPSTKVSVNNMVLLGEGDNLPYINIKQANNVLIKETEVEYIEFPDMDTIGIQKTQAGIYINSGSAEIGLVKPSAIPEIHIGSEKVISSETMAEILDNATAGVTPFIPAKGGHAAILNSEKAVGCIDNGNSRYYTCVHCGKHFSDAACTEEIEEGSWVIEAKGHDLSFHESNDPDCITDGNDPYYSCSKCGKYYMDEECTEEIEKDSWIIGKTGHDSVKHEGVDGDCTCDGSDEYYSCKNCDKYFSDSKCTEEIEEDSWTIKARGHSMTYHKSCATEYWECTECGRYYCDEEGSTEIQPDSIAVHNPVFHEGKTSDCTHEGNDAYYSCDGCGGLFSDVGCTEEIEEGSWIIPKTKHSLKTVTKSAGHLKNGYKLTKCTSCGTVTKKTTIKGWGSYGVKSLKAKAGKKAVTLKWAKPSKKGQKELTGYEIKYSTSKSFKTYKTVKVKSSKVTSKKLTKLKAKKTYYIKVRTYVVRNGITYYSKEAKLVKVKTK